MNCKILVTTFLSAAILCSCNNKREGFISHEESKKRVQNAIDSVLKSKEFSDKKTGGILPDTLRSFMRAYRDQPLAIVDVQQDTIKGFFIDTTLIGRIQRDTRPINGFYIYFGKKIHPYQNISSQPTSQDFNGKYTIIAIPSIASGTPGKDSLLYLESLEWHDPVTRLKHTPVNERSIYSPNN